MTDAIARDGLTPDQWRDRAACSGRSDINWFPERGEDQAAAKAVCAGCPVKDPCLEDALTHGGPGIWGMTSERERRFMRRVS